MVQASVPQYPPQPLDASPLDLWQTRQPGVYLLLVRLEAPTELEVGRLGRVALPAGWWVYIGSALGGLGARLRRHARREKRHHWHIDWLLAAGQLVAVAARPGAERIECQTAALVAGLPGAEAPVSRFGASDCRCPTHLVWFSSRPALEIGCGWRQAEAPPHPRAARHAPPSADEGPHLCVPP